MRGHPGSVLVGILGWPLESTLSPAMHNAAFRRAGLDWVYLAFPVPPTLLGDAVRGLGALGSRGANVTMPHKEAVIPFLDELSGDAKMTGAVNTIQELGGRLIGHNTDVDGFRTFVQSDAGFDCAGKQALVLGAGGAARAVVRALDDLGIGDVKVAARRPEQAASLEDLHARLSPCAWEAAGKEAADCDVVVNTTPLGSGGEDPLPEADLGTGQFVVDLVYRPPVTPLIERARASGAEAWGGLGMLVHQAVAAWRIWTGQEPPVEAMSAAALHALGAPRAIDQE